MSTPHWPRSLLLGALLAAAGGAFAASISVGAAPKGDAKAVASRIIKKNFPACQRVAGAQRRPDGAIQASCDGTSYLIFTVFHPKEGRVMELALNCAAAKKHLDLAC